MEIGERIKEARKERGVLIKELSEKIGYSSAYISQIENGKRDKPSQDFIDEVSKELGISTYYLVTGKKTWGDVNDEDFPSIGLSKNFKNPIVGLQDQLKLSGVNFNEKFTNPFTELNLEREKNLKERLKKLIETDLSFIEVILLNQIILYLTTTDYEEQKILAAFLTSFNLNSDVAKEDDESFEAAKSEVEYLLKQIKKLLEYRYGISDEKLGD